MSSENGLETGGGRFEAFHVAIRGGMIQGVVLATLSEAALPNAQRREPRMASFRREVPWTPKPPAG